MNNKKALVIIALVFVLLLSGAYVLYQNLGSKIASDNLSSQAAQDEAQEPEKQLAPDFTVYDAEGNAHKLSDWFGKPIVLNFWASWCGPCKMEMPDFDEKYLELGEDITFLMVNMTDGTRETLEKASAFIEESGYSFPVYYDLDSDAAYVYNVYSLPTTYFINAEGNAIAQASGAISAETLQTGIDMITN